jgi:hypothetical protein
LNDPRCRRLQQRTINKFASGLVNGQKRTLPASTDDGARHGAMMSLVDYSSSEDEQNEESALKVANETSRTTTKLPSLPSDFYDLYSGTSFFRLD